jgi:hypothetical protein
MKLGNAIPSTTTQLLLGAVVALWQSTIALGGTPANDAQAQARALLSPPIVHSTAGREPDRLAEGTHHLDAADDAHSQARRLLLGIHSRDSEGNAVSPPVAHHGFAASTAPVSAVGDAQDAARRMILGRDERVGRPATAARRPGVPTATHLADQ